MWYLPRPAAKAGGRHASASGCKVRAQAIARVRTALGTHPPPPEAYTRFILRSVSRSAACVRSIAPSSSATIVDCALASSSMAPTTRRRRDTRSCRPSSCSSMSLSSTCSCCCAPDRCASPPNNAARLLAEAAPGQSSSRRGAMVRPPLRARAARARGGAARLAAEHRLRRPRARAAQAEHEAAAQRRAAQLHALGAALRIARRGRDAPGGATKAEARLPGPPTLGERFSQRSYGRLAALYACVPACARACRVAAASRTR